MNQTFVEIEACRISGAKDLVTFLPLGDQPLANSLPRKEDEFENRIPLTLAFSPTSSLVQLKATVRKEILFTDYVWVTGTSSTARSYALTFCQRMSNLANPQKNDLILEIASNDGTFLIPWLHNGFTNVLGIDPASNIAKIATRNGVATINSFWNLELSNKVKEQKGEAKVVFARNVIPHVSDVHGVVAGIRNILRDDGVGAIEFHYAGEILRGLQYDSIYHEHLCYFSVRSMEYLLHQHGLEPFHLDPSPISGGSYVVYFSRRGMSKTAAYEEASAREEYDGINNLSTWTKFADNCFDHRDCSRQALEEFKDRKIIGFGASARSSTYLNFCGLDREQILAVIDNNPMKQGKFTPGSHIPIVSFEEGLKLGPDLIFILAWNFKDEIIDDLRSRGGYKGAFLIPFPTQPYFEE